MSQDTTTVQNRSEIVFVTDAQDCNPNGNPLGENRPRVDPVTDQAVVTDVRLKRYLRDQLVDDSHPVFVRKTADGTSAPRARLALNLFEDVETEEDLDRIEDIRREFLRAATDVRYFGATLSFNKDSDDEMLEAVRQVFADQGNFTGPVQFSPARSLNAVELNEESNALTSVISTQEGKETGGFDLDDHRIKYGIFPFHGVVDEQGAADTDLTPADVRRLDTLCWRALKNQTISRSKVGQAPRLYVRVEFATDGFHDGDLHNALEHTPVESDAALRNVTDLRLDASAFVDRLVALGDHIETVHVVGSDYLALDIDGYEDATAADLGDVLADRGLSVREIDVYSEFEETLPADEETSDGAI